LIGIGLLGAALAKRLFLAGFPVLGYDPDPAASERLRSLGGAVASPEQIAQTCRRILFCLPGPAQVQETVDRVAAHLASGTIILDTTTGDPELVETTAWRLATAGVFYLDSEIGGSSRQAEAGEAIVICGGDEQAYLASCDILSALGRLIFHTGAAGTGTRMKLALNLAIGLHRAVLAESLEFARANGIDVECALEILKAGPAYSKAMDVKGSKMLTGDFTPEARLAQHLKDVRLILQTGGRLGAHLPLSCVHETILSEAVDLGLGAEDNSAVIKVFARKSR
jgi:3-hydroxyisobutyrate dehydrogenase-like beta-hydroxyacid dehydrogenase